MSQHLDLIGVNISNFGFRAREFTCWFCLNYIALNCFIRIIVANFAIQIVVIGNRLAVLVNVMSQHLDLIGVNISNFCFRARKLASRFCLNYIALNCFIRIIVANLAIQSVVIGNRLAILVNIVGQHFNLVSVNISNFGFSAREFASRFCLNYVAGNFLCGIIIANLAIQSVIIGNRLAVLVNIVGQHLDLIGVNVSDFGYC